MTDFPSTTTGNIWFRFIQTGPHFSINYGLFFPGLIPIFCKHELCDYTIYAALKNCFMNGVFAIVGMLHFPHIPACAFQVYPVDCRGCIFPSTQPGQEETPLNSVEEHP